MSDRNREMGRKELEFELENLIHELKSIDGETKQEVEKLEATWAAFDNFDPTVHVVISKAEFNIIQNIKDINQKLSLVENIDKSVNFIKGIYTSAPEKSTAKRKIISKDHRVNELLTKLNKPRAN